MRVLKIIGSVLLVALIVVLLLALRQPDEFFVTRSETINAPAAKIFPHINNLELGQAWSPWVEMEPDAQFTFEGPKEGNGAIIHWEGQASGKGTMTIVDSVKNKHVRSRLDFQKPMEATNTTEMLLEPVGNQTKVTWSMQGENNFLNKVLGVLMNCEKIVGDQFSKGLSNLKTLVEKK